MYAICNINLAYLLATMSENVDTSMFSPHINIVSYSVVLKKVEQVHLLSNHFRNRQTSSCINYEARSSLSILKSLV